MGDGQVGRKPDKLIELDVLMGVLLVVDRRMELFRAEGRGGVRGMEKIYGQSSRVEFRPRHGMAWHRLT